MRKTSKKSGINSASPEVDFLSLYRNAPEHQKQQSSLQDLMSRVQATRKEKSKG